MKAQLCSCPARELGASGRMCCLLCDGGILGLFVLLTPWQGRLVLEEKAYDYFKYRHFLFSGITNNELQSDHHGTVRIPSSPTPPQMQQLTIRTRTACTLFTAQECWGLWQVVTSEERRFTVTQCKLCTCAPSLSLCLPQPLFRSGRVQ